MRDLILKNFIDSFQTQYGIKGLSESELFEQFVAHCIVSKHHPESFDPDALVTGDGGDLGIDGIAVLVNEHLTFAIEDVDHFKRALRRLDVEFVFIQAKTSAHFDGAEIGNFVAGVRQFFEKQLPADANAAISSAHSVKEYIYDRSIDMDRSPVCRLYYVTTGSWQSEVALITKMEQGKKDLTVTGLFSSVEFSAIDAEGLKRIYRDIHNKIIREINFEKHTILPKINGVQEAYIGIVPCTEFLKLVCEEDGSLNRRLFYDNVRDFQGHNAVNHEMRETITDTARNDLFVLMNNGVTLVAKDINKVGTTFRLKDFQIVNGCQTSHILYLNRESLSSKVYLSLKLIVTEDTGVTNQITHGTNRQTEVKPEAFESLTPFQKRLEEYYVAASRALSVPLFYERRSKQHEHLEVSRERIITLAAQLKCFLAMFLNEPHSTHRYYGELLEAYRSRLFVEAHSPAPYFVSGLALAKVESLFQHGGLNRSVKPYKVQLLMLFRVLTEDSKLPFLNSKAIDKYCDRIIKALNDESLAHSRFTEASELILQTLAKWKGGREYPQRTKVFTSMLLGAVGTESTEAVSSRVSGRVKVFSSVTGWGFITGSDQIDYFAHYTAIRGGGYRTLYDGQAVTFTPMESPRGWQATDITSE